MPKVSRAFPAKYNGKCPICNQWWKAGSGTMLNYVDGVLQHVKCPTRPALVPQVTRKERSYQTNAVQPSINIPLAIEDHPVEEGGDNAFADALTSAIEEASSIDLTAETPREEIKSFTPSVYQQAIFDFIAHGEGHGVIEAVAGSGKTTTIVKALDLTPTDAKVAFVAFNRHIAKELEKRAPDHVHVSTLHSLGLSIIRKNAEKGKVEIDDDKVGTLLEEIYPTSKEALKAGLIDTTERRKNWTKRFAMRKVVSIAKATLLDYNKPEEVLGAIDRYGIEIDLDFVPEAIEQLPKLMLKCKELTSVIDFDDMIWLPIVNNMNFEKFSYMFVDEWQDMNFSNIEFLLRCLADNGRMIVVGDKFQSLYAFRGATPEAMDIAIHRLHATVLPLSVTYRCPTSHVNLAKQIVPQLEARENAPEGKVEKMDYFDLAKRLQPGDMCICRTNAPLVKPAFECIRMKKKAVIRGKDIGASLINLIKRFETDDLAQFEISLNEYYEREFTRLVDKGKEMQALLLQDRVETLRFIINESGTVSEVMSKIEMLFSDNNIGIVFSSVHRAKGLEADNVFILHPEQMPHKKAKQDWEKQQEMNVKYVAQTRSKNNLIFVLGGE